MKYADELRYLVKNLLKKPRGSSDYLIVCPRCGTSMEFKTYSKPRFWLCLGRECGFKLFEEQLLGPYEIDKLIKEVTSENRAESIKNIIREIIIQKGGENNGMS